MKVVLAMVCFLSLGAAAPCAAQSGVLDQSNPPPPNAVFEASWFGSFWQQQVRVGVTGKLSGVTLDLGGPLGSHIAVRLRLGDGWNTGPVVFETLTLRSTSNPEELYFIDTTAANIHLAAGSTFVIEWEGQNEGGNLWGTWSSAGAPVYPEPLFAFLLLPNCYLDCRYRICFETYMIPGPIPPVEYCTPGTTTNGCTATISGTNPDVAHATPCTILVDGVEGNRPGIVFYGLASTTQPWCAAGGTSFLCVKAPTTRAASQVSGGTGGQCDGSLVLDWNAYQLATSGAPGQPWAAGNKAYVQGWFRDPLSCKSTNLSNALELTYQP